MLMALHSGLLGLQRAKGLLDRSAQRIARSGSTSPGAGGERVDIASEIVGAIVAKHGFSANAGVIRTADEMLGTLVDLKA